MARSIEVATLTPTFAVPFQMEAEDNGGDSAELWITLNAMGYNVALLQDECALFEVSVRSEKGDGGGGMTLGVSGLKSGGSVLDKACNKCVMDGSKRTKRHLDKNEEIFVYREVRGEKGIKNIVCLSIQNL